MRRRSVIGRIEHVFHIPGMIDGNGFGRCTLCFIEVARQRADNFLARLRERTRRLRGIGCGYRRFFGFGLSLLCLAAVFSFSFPLLFSVF